ncbi:MAG TPA: hypothetical protein PKH60_04710 [Candidatus Woesebacteria bacterium]|nr:hypothetical protein [Candidatus Woesebacteria bacterium]
MPMGLSGRNIAKLGAGAAGTALATPFTAGAGALIGSKMGYGAKKGAMVGAALPAGIVAGIPLAKRGVSVINKGVSGIQNLGKSYTTISNVAGSVGTIAAAGPAMKEAKSFREKVGIGMNTATEVARRVSPSRADEIAEATRAASGESSSASRDTGDSEV